MAHARRYDDEDPLLARLRSVALAFPGATEVETHGRPTFRVGRIFAMYGLGEKGREHPRSLVLKPDEEDRVALEQDPRSFRPAYVGAWGWLGLDLATASDEVEGADGAAVDWQEVAELLDTTVASINSALQRARATLETAAAEEATLPASMSGADGEMLSRYVEAFERYDMDALTSLIHEDATQSMPPFDLWLRGRDDIFTWWFGPGIGCKGSRVIPTVAANGSPAFGQYKPADDGGSS